MSKADLSNLDSIIEHFEEIRTKIRNILEKQDQTFLETKHFYEGELNMCNTVIRTLKMHKGTKKKSKEELKQKLMSYFTIKDSDAYWLTRVKQARQYGTLTIDDFEEFEEDTIDDIVEYVFTEDKQ